MKTCRVLMFSAVIALLGYQSSALAACTTIRCNAKVRSIYTTQSEGMPKVFIRVEESVEEIAKLNCDPGSGSYIVLSSNHPAFKELYSNLLAAGASKATLNLRVGESPGNPCQLAYIVYTF